MGLIASDSGGGGSFTLPPADIHNAICVGVIDLGTQHNERYNKYQRQVYVLWELPDVLIEINKNDETHEVPATCSKFYTLNLGETSNLRKDLESWRGREFTSDELSGFDLKNILDVRCRVQIMHKMKSGNNKAEIAAIFPADKKAEPATRIHDLVWFSFEEEFSLENWNKVSDGIQGIIKKSTQAKENGLPIGEGVAEPPDESINEIPKDVPF